MAVAKQKSNTPRSARAGRSVVISRNSRTGELMSLNLALSNESYSIVKANPEFMVRVIERAALKIGSVRRAQNLDDILDLIIEMPVEDGTSAQSSQVKTTIPPLQDALFKARARGQIKAAEILDAPDMLTTDELAEILRLSRPAVNAQRQSGKLLGLEGARRGFKFPKWQLDENEKPYEGIGQLNKLLGEPWLVYRFLVQRHGALDGLTGLEALKNHKIGAVVEAAKSYGRDFS